MQQDKLQAIFARKSENMRAMEYLLVTTEHLEDRLLFRDAEDFRTGMNHVAVQVSKCQVRLLAFILMSNHLHFVMQCGEKRAAAFVNGFKQSFSRYLQNKYGSREHLRGNGVDIRVIPPEGEALERALAYVQMNCVAANICGSPWDYPWGTGSCFFRAAHSGLPDADLERDGSSVPHSGGVLLKAMSSRKKYRIFHSKADLPGEWEVSDAGYIQPWSYVQRAQVENIFGSPRRMLFFMNNSSKARLRLETGEQCVPAFKDQVVAAAMEDLCRSLFRKKSVLDLGEEMLVELLRQLRYRFSANVNQLARVTGLTYERTAEFLDRV